MKHTINRYITFELIIRNVKLNFYNAHHMCEYEFIGKNNRKFYKKLLILHLYSYGSKRLQILSRNS